MMTVNPNCVWVLNASTAAELTMTALRSRSATTTVKTDAPLNARQAAEQTKTVMVVFVYKVLVWPVDAEKIWTVRNKRDV